ncbi:MAG: AAA family ATPase, partial [Phormidesmis sp. CAN_BIN44]|nr:AAA family ATPase [Phormidesmis sp. CAN_BIN44]
FTTDDILEAASQTVPLAQTAKEQIDFLQEWAAAGKARLASKHSSLSDRIQRQRQQPE